MILYSNMTSRRLFVSLLLLLFLTDAASAKSILLQTADLNDKNMSTQGGYAKLIRVSTSKGSWCSIEATHYGETGKAIYTFTFGTKLYSALLKDYSYNQSIYNDPNVKIVRTETMSLQSREGRRFLPERFNEYKTFFSARDLAKCIAGRARR